MPLPNFLVIGAQRAGTTLLYELLQSHPEIYLPTSRKEIHFFDRYFDRGLDWYQNYFPTADITSYQHAIGEVTPDYLALAEVPTRIRQSLHDCRLIVILRNPVDRAYSWYQYCRRSWNEQADFATFLETDPTALEWGLYHKHLQRYLTLFPREALLVVLFEDLIADHDVVLRQVAGFLGLARAFPIQPGQLTQKVNSSDAPRFPRIFALARRVGHVLMYYDANWPVRLAKSLGVPRWFGRAAPPEALDPATRTQLAAFYDDDIRELGRLLQRDMGIWQPIAPGSPGPAAGAGPFNPPTSDRRARNTRWRS